MNYGYYSSGGYSCRAFLWLISRTIFELPPKLLLFRVNECLVTDTKFNLVKSQCVTSEAGTFPTSLHRNNSSRVTTDLKLAIQINLFVNKIQDLPYNNEGAGNILALLELTTKEKEHRDKYYYVDDDDSSSVKNY